MHVQKIDNLLLHPVRFHIAHVIVSNGGSAHIRRVRKHVIENDSSPAMNHHVVAMEAAGIIRRRKLIDDENRLQVLIELTTDGHRRFVDHCVALRRITESPAKLAA
jgi:hypothetical protein